MHNTTPIGGGGVVVSSTSLPQQSPSYQQQHQQQPSPQPAVIMPPTSSSDSSRRMIPLASNSLGYISLISPSFPPPFNKSKQHFYNRTKRKRDSSASASRNGYWIAHGDHESFQIEGYNRFDPFITTPWIKKSYPAGVVGLHEEIEDFYEWMIPTPTEHAVRLTVVERIREMILELWPGTRVEISGSFRTGLYLPSSDIDLVICGKWESLPLRTIERALLQKRIATPDALKVLDKAAVPIVKFTDSRSDIKVDISFNMSNGVRAAELIKHFKKRYPSLPKLIYVLKQFLLQRDLNEVFTGGLSSYSLILLVISFLQLHYSPETASSPKANLGVMLVEFLELYGRNFNYLQTAIRVTDGGSYVSKEQFRKNMLGGYIPALLSIEDPLDPTNDIGRSSYGFVGVQKTFERAYTVLTSLVVPGASPPANGKSILSTIVEISEDLINYRKRLNENFVYLRLSDATTDLPSLPTLASRVSLGEIEPQILPAKHYDAKEIIGEKGSEKERKESENSVVPDTEKLEEDKKPKSTSTASSSSATAVVKLDHDLSDSLSNVSTGTSLSSPIVLSSDTDSEVLVGPSVSPTSAMSISPANSEVGSSISNGKLHLSNKNNRKVPDSSSSSLSSSPLSSVSNVPPARKNDNGRNNETFKHPSAIKTKNFWGGSGGKNSFREGGFRHDTVVNWRSPDIEDKSNSKITTAAPTSTSATTTTTITTSTSSSSSTTTASITTNNAATTTSPSCSTSKSVSSKSANTSARGSSSSVMTYSQENRADLDTNWRNHDPPPANPKNRWKNSFRKSHQARTTLNNKESVRENHNSGNNNSAGGNSNNGNSSSGNNNTTSSKASMKKRKKSISNSGKSGGGGGGGGQKSAVAAANNVPAVVETSNRFSPQARLGNTKR